MFCLVLASWTAEFARDFLRWASAFHKVYPAEEWAMVYRQWRIGSGSSAGEQAEDAGRDYFGENPLAQERHMQVQPFAGRWVFDPEHSKLVSQPPTEWLQKISTKDGRIRVREEISRPIGTTIVEVDAVPDEDFYVCNGSPIADEISYGIAGLTITGIARKGGVISLRETLDFSIPGTMTMNLQLVRDGREIPLGVAYFTKLRELSSESWTTV